MIKLKFEKSEQSHEHREKYKLPCMALLMSSTFNNKNNAIIYTVNFKRRL